MAKHKEGTLKEGDDQQEKEFVCDQCGKIYGNYKSWFYHVKSHSIIYQCQTCPRAFKTPRGLKYHMALHTGIASFGRVPESFYYSEQTYSSSKITAFKRET